MRDQYQLTEIRDLFADPAAFDGKKITKSWRISRP